MVHVYLKPRVYICFAWWRMRGVDGGDGGGDVVLMLGSGMPLCTVVCVSMAKR